MSNRRKSNMRPSTTLCGRFLECEPSRKREVSALRARNSSDASPPVSNGRTCSLLRLSFSDSPRFRLPTSVRKDLTT